MSHARLLFAAGLLAAGFAGRVQAAAPITLNSATVLVRTGDTVECSVISADPRNAADLTVELIDPSTGSVFGFASSCPGTGLGGFCFQQLNNPDPVRRVDCVVTTTTKKVRALLANTTTGIEAEVK